MAKFAHYYDVDCPACRGGHVVKIGQRNGYQRYQCRECKKKFRFDGQAEGRRYDATLIGATIRDYYMGLSIKQLAESIAARYGIPEPSKNTIYGWISDYTDKATYATRDLKAQTGDHWVVDEMIVKVGGEYCYHWNVLDKDTRYLLATHLSRTRDTSEGVRVLRKALSVAGRTPKRITTDKYPAYPLAIRTVFPMGVKHIQSKGAKHFVNNNMSERMQGIYRDRERTMRGLDCIESGQQLLDGFTLTYNHFRKHSSLGNRTPGEVAKVEMPFAGWADVVRADITVPETWKRKPTKRRLGPKAEKAEHKKRGRRPRAVLPEDAERGKVKRKPQSPRVQLGFFKKRRPSKADRERATEAAAKAPQPAKPPMGLVERSQPQHKQPRLLPLYPDGIPKRVRPRLVGRNRR